MSDKQTTNRPLAFDERMAAADKKQQKVQVTVACVMFAIAGFLFYWNKQMAEIPPPPNAVGYYEGPWVNKNGDLVSGDGKILQRDYRGQAVRRAHAQRSNPGAAMVSDEQ